MIVCLILLQHCIYGFNPHVTTTMNPDMNPDDDYLKDLRHSNRILREALAVYACTDETNLLVSVLNGGYCLVAATDETSPLTGGWYNTGNIHAYGHFPGDVGMTHKLSEFLPPNSNILDVGAGQGQYKFLFSHIRPDIQWTGIDGAINIEQYTKDYIQYHDICTHYPLEWVNQYDWVFSIEVAEHLPIECQENYISLLIQTSRVGIVLSWSDEYAPPHHINPRNNAYVKNLLSQYGYIADEEAEIVLRESVSELLYLKDTLMIFRNVNID